MFKYYAITYEQYNCDGKPVRAGWKVRRVLFFESPVKVIKKIEEEMNEKYPDLFFLLKSMVRV